MTRHEAQALSAAAEKLAEDLTRLHRAGVTPLPGVMTDVALARVALTAAAEAAAEALR